MRKSLSRLRSIGGLAGGIGVGFGLAEGFRDATEFADVVQRLESQARLSGDALGQWGNRITEASSATGIARDKIAGALDEMVNLQGKAGLSATTMNTLATGMKATGTEGRDLARVMFTLTSNMKISEDQMRAVLGGIDAIGTESSIPFSQLASSYTEVAAAASNMGAKGPDGVFSTVAAMQAMRKQITTPDEIKTAFTGFADELVKKAPQIQRALGVTVAKGKGRKLVARDLFAIVSDLRELQKQGKITGDAVRVAFGKRSGKGIVALLNNFDEFERLRRLGIQGAKQDFLGLREMERANSTAGKLEKATNDLKLAFATSITPQTIEDVAAALSKVAGLIKKVSFGYSQLMSLFDSGSRNRRLIADTDTKTLIGAAANAFRDTGLAGVLPFVGADDEQFFRRPGDIDAFDRPAARAARAQLSGGSGGFMGATIRQFEQAVLRGTAGALKKQPVKVAGSGGGPATSPERSNPQ